MSDRLESVTRSGDGTIHVAVRLYGGERSVGFALSQEDAETLTHWLAAVAGSPIPARIHDANLREVT